MQQAGWKESDNYVTRKQAVLNIMLSRLWETAFRNIFMNVWVYTHSLVVHDMKRENYNYGQHPIIKSLSGTINARGRISRQCWVPPIGNRIKYLSVPCSSRLTLTSSCLTAASPAVSSVRARLVRRQSASLLAAISPTFSADLDCETRSWSASLLAAVSSTVNMIWGRFSSSITQRHTSRNETATCLTELGWRGLHDCVCITSIFVALVPARELAKATYSGAAPPFDACAPSFVFCAPSFKCPLKSNATLRKDGPSPSASFGPAPRPA